MKKLITVLLFTFASVAAAAEVKDPAIRKYVTKSLTRCPGSSISIQPINRPAPKGFLPYHVVQTSSDKNCGADSTLLVSPQSKQAFLGSVAPIPQDYRPLEARLGEVVAQMVRSPHRLTVTPANLPDGLRLVTIFKKMAVGEMPYHGYVDGNGRFFIVARRGFLSQDPGATTLANLGAAKAPKRGAKQAKLQLVEISDLQCPSCKRAHELLEPFLKKNASKVSMSRIDLPLIESHEWALDGAMGSRAIQVVAPAKYWEYVDYIFRNQESITKANVEQFIRDFAEERDIDWKKLEVVYRSPQERNAMIAQAGRIFDEGVYATPTFLANGQPLYFMGDMDALVKELTKLMK